MTVEVVLITFFCIIVISYVFFRPVRDLIHSAFSRLRGYVKESWIFGPTTPVSPEPVSVNYHFTRKCNFECGFCFHTEKTSHVEPFEEMKRGLTMLKEAGMKKINFAGGEPLLYPKLLSLLVQFCKTELHLESISIVTNGSRLTERFLEQSAKYIDIIAISCDSFKEDVNVKFGRGKGSHLEQVRKVSKLCKAYGIKLKLNTVVNRYNFDEDMNEGVRQIDPFRWKCFQVLIVEGENDSKEMIRDASRFAITDEEFQRFCDTHSHNDAFVPEPNNIMRSSYLIIDEYMRFLNKGTGDPTESILKVGVEKAMQNVLWDTESFYERGGVYDWTKEGTDGCGTEQTGLGW
jgi:radical S-adenosyl methionine domain-containing protein 2